jgi:hypothetical protein
MQILQFTNTDIIILILFCIVLFVLLQLKHQSTLYSELCIKYNNLYVTQHTINEIIDKYELMHILYNEKCKKYDLLNDKIVSLHIIIQDELIISNAKINELNKLLDFQKEINDIVIYNDMTIRGNYENNKVDLFTYYQYKISPNIYGELNIPIDAKSVSITIDDNCSTFPDLLNLPDDILILHIYITSIYVNVVELTKLPKCLRILNILKCTIGQNYEYVLLNLPDEMPKYLRYFVASGITMNKLPNIEDCKYLRIKKFPELQEINSNKYFKIY